MRARCWFLLLNSLFAAALSGAAVATTPVIQGVEHPGSSGERIERAYLDAYTQSGFRLVDRRKTDGYAGSWTVTLAFALVGAAPNDAPPPGTTLSIDSGALPTPCTPCRVSRIAYVWPDAGSPDRAASARGETTLGLADAAALAKVRQRLGVSLPKITLRVPARAVR